MTTPTFETLRLPTSPEQLFHDFMRQQLPAWNTAALFPEGLGSDDVFRLKAAGDLFIQERKKTLEGLQRDMSDAAGRQDAGEALRALDATMLLRMDATRVRVFFKLLQVQHPQSQAYSSLYEHIATECNGIDAALERFAEPLAKLPEATRQALLNQAPGLSDHITALFPERYPRYPGHSPEEAAQIGEAISGAKVDYMRLYHDVRAPGPIRAHDNARLEQVAGALNQMMQVTEREARLEGYPDAMSRYSAYQHLPPQMLTYWLNNAQKPTREASAGMHALNTVHKGKDEIIAKARPEGQATFSLVEARQIVTDALCKFNPNFRPILDQAFDENWVQTRPIPNNIYGGETYNNVSGALYPAAHPFVLSEFRGTMFDVIRLAHELGGHCLSIELANKAGQVNHVTDSTLQETFALFSQRLVEEEMLAHTDDPVKRAAILRTAADDWYQNLYETSARCRFQAAAFTAARQPDGSLRSLSAADYSRIFATTNADIAYGLNRKNPDESVRWANIHHYITQPPFYNASYGFATMASAALFEQWQRSDEPGRHRLANNWMHIMQLGGTVRFPAAMAQMGIDVANPAFMTQGVQSVNRAIAAANEAAGKVSGFKLFMELSFGDKWDFLTAAIGRWFDNDQIQPATPLPARSVTRQVTQTTPGSAQSPAPPSQSMAWTERMPARPTNPDLWQDRFQSLNQPERDVSPQAVVLR